MNTRRKRLEKFCNTINCDTLVTFEPENLFYMTGFWGEAIGILEVEKLRSLLPNWRHKGQRKIQSTVML